MCIRDKNTFYKFPDFCFQNIVINIIFSTNLQLKNYNINLNIRVKYIQTE